MARQGEKKLARETTKAKTDQEMEECDLVKTQKRLADEIGITVVKLHREENEIGSFICCCLLNIIYSSNQVSYHFSMQQYTVKNLISL